MTDAWDNRPYFELAPAALKVPPPLNEEWLDWQHARFAHVDAPGIGSHVLYLELRSRGPEGAISRQRICSFRTDANAGPMPHMA